MPEKKIKLYYTVYNVLAALVEILLLFAVIYVIGTKLFSFNVVVGPSMSPTIREGSVMITNRLSYVTHDIKRGDIVLIRSADGSNIVKRIIGVPGDSISFDNGYLVINGSYADELYLPADTYTFCTESFEVPEEHYFVMGDNRIVSHDSRDMFEIYIPKDDIEGRVFAVIGKEKGASGIL